MNLSKLALSSSFYYTPYLSVSKVPITQPRARERERERKRVPRDFSILLILETGSRELIGGGGRGPKVKRRKPSRREG